LAVQKSPDPTLRLKGADCWPVVASLVPETLWSAGIGSLFIARRITESQWACAVFLVDVFCLGVKDALWKIVTPGEFRTLCQKFGRHGRLQEVTPEQFAKLVYRAADFGQSLGFPPHRDFRHAQRLLAGIDPSQCPDEFQFGQNGRPMYFRGPNESLEEAQRIAARVESLGGHYTVMLQPSEVPPEFEAFTDTIDEDDAFDVFDGPPDEDEEAEYDESDDDEADDDEAEYDEAEYDEAEYDEAEYDEAEYDEAEYDEAEYDEAECDDEPRRTSWLPRLPWWR
jgi:hypothetical protein